MTEQNFKYRTDPLFLRNQFYGIGKYGMPLIPKFESREGDFEDLRLIGFDVAKTEKDEHFDRMVHFFLYDYKFECFWGKPENYIGKLKKYKAVLAPDFSMYIEMANPLKIYNTFRNRWCGAYLASKGIRVIPTVNWGLKETFDFCFEGIEKGSTVAVSTYMVSKHNNHAYQKEFFMAGYNEMLKRIEPEVIICYNTPFPEMEGNIIFVDYELSSWRHMNEDISQSYSPYLKYICGEEKWPENCDIIRKVGYVIPDVEKGSGSAYGGKWIPKKEDDERFLGEPGSINRTWCEGKKGGYARETKIGEDGRATKERHLTDHGRPWAHTDPHDHTIEWDQNTGAPRPSSPINYPDGALEFKSYEGGANMNNGNVPNDEYFEENRFKTINEFKWAMSSNSEVEFEWENKIYGIVSDPNGIAIYEANKQETEKICASADEVLEYMLGECRLRDVITKVRVWSRTI